jgi:hypothetical protein
MLKSERKFAFIQGHELFYANSSKSAYLAILKGAVRCPDQGMCLKWANIYHKFQQF